MASNCRLSLLLQVVSAIHGKYVFVEEDKNWDEARDHCRQEYTDLAPISNDYDSKLLFEQNNDAVNKRSIWIGLMRNQSNENQWLWSGGDKVNKPFWRNGEPNNAMGNEDRGEIYGDLTWNDAAGQGRKNFFCYDVHVVRERKTWEEALYYCRRHHRDLASVASETELMLMRDELSQQAVSEHVWIGMRFLGEEWLWMDGQPLEFEAWGPGGKPRCSTLQRCAALQVTGTSYSGTSTVNTVSDVSEWNPQSCDNKLHFLCY